MAGLGHALLKRIGPVRYRTSDHFPGPKVELYRTSALRKFSNSGRKSTICEAGIVVA